MQLRIMYLLFMPCEVYINLVVKRIMYLLFVPCEVYINLVFYNVIVLCDLEYLCSHDDI